MPGQNARVSFAGTQNQRISLDLSNVTVSGSAGPAFCCSTLVSLLKPDGTALGGATYIGTSGGFVDTQTLPVTGAYTVLIDPQGDDTGSASVQVHDVPADAGATATPGGAAVTLSTSVPGQNARVSFSETAGQGITAILSGVTISGSSGPTSCCSALASLLGPDGSTVVTSTYVGTSGGSLSSPTLSTTGSYTLLIDPQGNDTGNITVQLTATSQDIHTSAAIGGAAVTVTTTSPGQTITLSFSGVTISGSGGPVFCCSTLVSILKPDGTTLVGGTYIGTSGGSISTGSLPADGSYTVVIDPQAEDTGNMTITAS